MTSRSPFLYLGLLFTLPVLLLPLGLVSFLLLGSYLGGLIGFPTALLGCLAWTYLVGKVYTHFKRKLEKAYPNLPRM